MIIHFHLLLIIIHNMFFHKKCMFGFYLLLFPCLLLMLNVNYHNDQDAHGKEQDRKYICRKLTSCMVRKTTDKFILKIVELSKVFFFWGSVGTYVSQTSKYEKVWDHYIKDSVLCLFFKSILRQRAMYIEKICSPVKELT